MRTLLTVCVILAAGGLAAQAQQMDQSLGSGPAPQLQQNPMVVRPQDRYEIHGSRFVADGVAVEVIKSPNPLRMFNPFDPDNFATAHDNVVRDDKGNVLGLSLISIKF